MELWLTEPKSDRHLSIGIYGSRWGILRQVITNCNFDTSAASASDAWDYGRWYRFVVEGTEKHTRLSLRTNNDQEIWGRTYLWGLSNLGGAFRVSLAQHVNGPGSGVWKTEAAVDRVRVLTNMLPLRHTVASRILAPCKKQPELRIAER